MQSLYISSSALRSMQQGLEVTSNNLANLDTVGYKRRGASFSELLQDQMQMQPDKDNQNRTTPFGIRVGSGAKLGMTRIDTTQGSAKITEVPTDLMIDGEGFFLVIRPSTEPGVEDQYFLTRNGALSLQQAETNGVFTLVNAAGDKLADEDGSVLELDMEPGDDLTITADGRILINGEEIATRIPIVAIPNPDQYRQVGDNEFLLNVPEDLLSPVDMLQFTNYVNPRNPGQTLVPKSSIRQGALEASNVNMTLEMAELISTQRAFQLNSRAIGIADQMMGIANSLRNR